MTDQIAELGEYAGGLEKELADRTAAFERELALSHAQIDRLLSTITTAYNDAVREAAGVARTWKDCGHDFDVEQEILALIIDDDQTPPSAAQAVAR